MANIIHTPTGIKVGSKGKVAKTHDAVGTILGGLSKSDARKVRRELHGRGKRSLAAAVRLTQQSWDEVEAA